MNTLLKIFGVPHELLHVVALWLIGRRAVEFTARHVLIPDDLSIRQYIFVAAFPGGVFAFILCLGMVGVLQATAWQHVLLAIFAIISGGFGVTSAFGDFDLIVMRLQERNMDNE